jgi:hypothetical protein
LLKSSNERVEYPAGAFTQPGGIEPIGGGGGVEVTVTVAEAVALPPVPTQFKLYVVLVVGVTTCVPLVALAPVNVPPLAVQLVASVVVQVSVAFPPAVIDIGVAEIVIVGVGDGVGFGVVTTRFTEFVALPPRPVQVSV